MSLLKRLEKIEQEKPADVRKLTRPTVEVDKFTHIFQKVQDKLISEIDLTKPEINEAEIRRKVDQILNEVLTEEHIFLSRLERDRLFNQLMDEILGYGPIQPLLNDDTINEIMVNGPYKVYIERNGKIEKTNITFRDSEHLMRIIDRILAPLGRRVDESCPYMDARLPDGSRVNVIIPPLSLIGPVLTIRKFVQLRQEHVVTLETRPPNIEGKGEVTMRDLVINALRMRPDRIIVGEVRGGEALDMLQAMNTGHDGSLTTLHSNSPRDALARIETMVLMAGVDIPIKAIRQQIASALDLIVHMERMKDGSRKVVQITEVQGMEGDTIVLQDIFVFEQLGIENGKIIGRLRPTGIRPKFMEKIEAAGIYLPPEIFGLKVGMRR